MGQTSLRGICRQLVARWAITVLAACTLAACVNSKKTGLVRIRKNQVLFESGNTGDVIAGNAKYYKFQVTLSDAQTALLSTNPDGSMSPSTIQFTQPNLDLLSTSKDANAPPAGTKLANITYYYPADANPNSDPVTGTGSNTIISKPFRYTDMRPVVQALTIPIKYRPALSGGRASDASASVTLGPSWGWKFTHYTYRRLYQLSDPGKKAYSKLNDHTSQWDLTPGIFFAPTVVALDSLHTNGKITTSKNVIGTTYGAFCVFGYNDFNLGLAAGIDNTYGSGPGSWWYNGKPWVGVVFSIDFFK